MGAFGTTFTTMHCRLEIVRRADGIGHYDDWLRGARTLHVGDLMIEVAAPEDILRSKQAAGRQKDVTALAQMRRGFEDTGTL